MYKVTVLATGKSKIFETKGLAHAYARKVMQKQGLSVNIQELKYFRTLENITAFFTSA